MANPPQPEPLHLLGLEPEELHRELQERLGAPLPPYRSRQIVAWLYQREAADFHAMTDLPERLRHDLAACAQLYAAEIAAEQCARDGTRKLLLRWRDHTTTECVAIPTAERLTACVSTQVGCPVACAFCASGIDGLQRNLAVGEIVEQALHVRRLAGRLTNVVFMGLGEPLANYDATVAAVRCLNAPWGLGLAARRMTISTVGLPKQMRRLAEEGLQVTLALSLHAPTDALRRELIPWAERVPLADLIAACRYYFEHTHREVTLEYILLDGVNNHPVHATELAALTRTMRANVNLIPYNPVSELPFKRPTDLSIDAFTRRLQDNGVNVHVRRSRGLDTDAACGQLRRRHAATAVPLGVPRRADSDGGPVAVPPADE